MVEHFGGYADYMNVPYTVAKAHEYVWRGKNEATAEQNKRELANLET